MDQDLIVSVVRSDSRRGAVAEALALIAADLRNQATAAVVLLTPPGIHADTLSATLDAMFHAGAVEAVIVESLATAERAGHRREAFGRAVRFVDPGEHEAHDLLTAIAGASCEITLAHVAKRSRLRLADHFTSLLPPSRRGLRQQSLDPTKSAVLPGVLVVDAFDANRTVVAGTDARAVTTIAAAAVGGAPYVGHAQIRVVGDALAPARVTRGRRLHSRLRPRATASHDRVA